MRAALAAGALALVLAPSAFADAVYHSSHIPFTPIGSAPLHSGFLENIHTNGNNVYAHENYVLIGAMPNTTYTVAIHVSASPTCASPFVNVNTAMFTTNPAGNGSADAVFAPAVVDGLANHTWYAFWTVSTGGSVAYMTACETIVLDSLPS